nr:immunoglobulin heavy chain junction region [Macaca mulatta]MOY19833.1 immunoglobulin heavy chain junction region [Macaca mulatta]MOY19924.1 immunoglobulin heavy chain junction region [Macaca mulatta]MOY20434.1 immunoglobulin heavy chain junction region [Macaca mulatta]MOY20831.1 immunoglobulin heavy chain junction region [Macaca mulatta]
CTTLSPDYW